MKNQFVDLGSHRLSVTTAGQGAPAVIFETGLMADKEAWLPVAGEVAKITQVLFYDRAGRGQSEAGPGPKTAAGIAAELSQVLQTLQIPKPVLIVGQSFGGVIARAFAARYPADVAGLVLVDPTHEHQFELIAQALPAHSSADTPSLSNFRQFWQEGYKDPHKNLERIDFPGSFAEIRKTKSYGNLPIWILVAGSAFNNLGLDEADAQALRAIMRGLHQQTAALSTQARLIVVANSDHFIQQDQPQAVSEAVCQAVRQIRAQK